MNLLKMPSADIIGDYNFGTILESKVYVSAANTSIDQLSKLESSMTKRQPRKTIRLLSAKWWTHLHLQREVRIVFPSCHLVMLASSFDDWSMLVLAADKQTLDSSMVPKLESPVISADGIVSKVIELVISVLSLLSFLISWPP